MGLNLNSKEVKTLLDLSNVEENLRPQHLDLDNWKSLFKNYQKYDQI